MTVHCEQFIIDADYIEKLDGWLGEHGISDFERMQIRVRLKLEPYDTRVRPQPPATGALDDHTLLKLAGTAWFNRDQESDPARPNNNGSWWRFGWAQGYKAATIRSQQEQHP